MHLKNIEENSCQKARVIGYSSLEEYIFLVFTGFFWHVVQF